MQQIKIIFFDIDGTLIDMQSKHISPRTVEALHRLRARAGNTAGFRRGGI